MAQPEDEALRPGTLMGAPLYREVKRRLTRGLAEGQWAQGAPLPSEAQLAARYQVSSGTVRKAIGELVAEHVLVRRPGRGTFVADRDRDYMLDRFFHIVDREGGKEFPDSKLLSFRAAKADATTARRLRLSRHAPIYELENVLYLQGKPVVFDRIKISRTVIGKLDEAHFRHRDKTIFGLYQHLCGVTVTRLEEWVRAVSAEPAVAQALGAAAAAALLGIERVAYTYEDLPVEYRERYVNTADHAYFNLLGMKAARDR